MADDLQKGSIEAGVKGASKKPIYKRKWFIALIIVIALIAAGIIAISCVSITDPAVKDAQNMDKNEFMKGCEEYDFNELAKDPETYEGRYVKMTVRVDNEFDEGYYECYTGDPGESPDVWCDNQLVVTDETEDDIIEGKVLTVYGVYTGKMEIETIFEDKNKLVSIAAVYVSGSEQGSDIEKMMEGVKFELKSDDGYGWREYEAIVENTTGAAYDNFDMDINLKSKDGTVVENEFACTENWEPGEKAAFNFETDVKFDSIEVKDWDYY